MLTLTHTLAGITALVAAVLARWLLLDADAPADAPCYPVGQYRPCRPGDCGELRTCGHRILLTRRVPAHLARTFDN